jgi:hypothetical protein
MKFSIFEKLIFFIHFYTQMFFQFSQDFNFHVIGIESEIQNSFIAKEISLRFSAVDLIDITSGSQLVQIYKIFLTVLWNDLCQEYSD